MEKHKIFFLCEYFFRLERLEMEIAELTDNNANLQTKEVIFFFIFSVSLES